MSATLSAPLVSSVTTAQDNVFKHVQPSLKLTIRQVPASVPALSIVITMRYVEGQGVYQSVQILERRPHLIVTVEEEIFVTLDTCVTQAMMVLVGQTLTTAQVEKKTKFPLSNITFQVQLKQYHLQLASVQLMENFVMRDKFVTLLDTCAQLHMNHVLTTLELTLLKVVLVKINISAPMVNFVITMVSVGTH